MLGLDSIKYIAVAVIALLIAAALWYVTGLRADLAISEQNTKKLEDAVAVQKETINTILEEQQKIKQINNELSTQIRLQNKDVENLRDRFTQSANGQGRDFGKVAAAKPQAVEKAVNKGTQNALRCLEIASGSPLTESEKNATTSSEINKECPSIANPKYMPSPSK